MPEPTQDEPADQPVEQQPQPDPEQLPDPGLWKWYRDPPAGPVVAERLASLRPQWGIHVVEFLDFIVPLPQTEKFMVPRENRGRTVEVEEKVTTWQLYMTVAGRETMCSAAQELNGWEVDYEPVGGPPETPGLMEVSGMLIYRERVTIAKPHGDGSYLMRRLGSRTGQVWIPTDARGGAKKSNPPEKAQTAAVGRALGLWGIGILPGSGVASLEEMLILRQTMAAGPLGADTEPTPRDRGQATEELLTVLEELRQLRNIPEEEFRATLARYVADRIGNRDAVEQATGAIHWRKLSDGQITLMLNNFRQLLRESKIDAGMGTQDQEE